MRPRRKPAAAAQPAYNSAYIRVQYIPSLRNHPGGQQAVPLYWTSKLQTQIALSTTEAEYIALSQSLPVMQLLAELRDLGHTTYSSEPRIHCKCFEDNAGALELARTPKMRPRTKHINLIYHHFREHVRNGNVKIYPIATSDQIADIFTKPLAQNLFLKLRKRLLQW